MDSASGNNPINNPRLDLLHSSGDNQQLAGAAGSYGPTRPKSSPAPRPKPQPSTAPASASAYVSAAQSERPKAVVPPPPLPPEPRKAPEPNLSAPSAPKQNRGGPVIIGIVVVLILGAIAGGIWLWLSHRPAAPVATKPATTAPAVPTNLNQVDGTGATLSQGVTTKKTQITFQFSDSTSATSGSFTPEVELESAGTSFTGQPTITGQAVPAGSSMQFSVSSATLKDGAYHWQARVSANGKTSGWATFGGDSSATAFTVDTTAPGAPTVASVAGTAVANPTVVTSNQPAIVGTTAPNATITVTVSPDSQSFTTTADANGNWTLTPNANIPNGQHELSITATDTAGNVSSATQVALTINPVTAAATAPVSGASGQPTAAKTAPATNLAQTGDNTTLVSGISLAIMVMAAAGIAWVRRRYVAF
ncbi:MAG TPA: Ig-like domain-containing protein [Candidatus Saccharimonadales bacterium]|nr:Ig-like domain-containing protein [Candidatus Saccharimonadales bacterium]